MRPAWVRDAFNVSHSALFTQSKNFPCTGVISLDRWINKIDLLSRSSRQPHHDLDYWQTPSSFKLFFKSRFGVVQSNTFFKFTRKCQFDGFWGIATIPKMYWSETLNERKVCKCAVTASSAVCVWVKPRPPLGGENRTDKCWHRVLDGVWLVKACMFAEWSHGGCDLLLQSTIGLYWFCCARILTNQLYVFESILMITNEQKNAFWNLKFVLLLLPQLENVSELFPLHGEAGSTDSTL